MPRKNVCAHTHIILLPWDLLGLGSDAWGGKLSCDATGPSFCSRASTPLIQGPSPSPTEGLLMAGEGGVLFSLRAARRQMLACWLPVIKRPPARLSPALCCAAKRRHAASCCGPWRAPRHRRRCRARPGRSPRASAAVAGVWAGCAGACCHMPRAGGGRLTVPHRGRAPFDTLCAWHWGALLPCECWRCCLQRLGRAVAQPAQLQAGGSDCPQLCHAAGRSVQRVPRKLLGAAVAHRAVPCSWLGHQAAARCAVTLLFLCMRWSRFQRLPSAVRGIFPIGKSLCSPSDPSLVCHPPAAVVPWLCNLLPPACTAHELSWLTSVCWVLLLLTPAKGILYP